MTTPPRVGGKPRASHPVLAAALRPRPASRPCSAAGVVLIGATIAVAFAEAGAGLVIGLSTSSVAITGLGLDSAIKVVAALVLLWELGGRRDAAQERRALRLLALAFFAVAAYVAVASVEELAAAREPIRRPAGSSSPPSPPSPFRS